MRHRFIEISAIKIDWGVKSKTIPTYRNLLKRQAIALREGDLETYKICKMAIDEHYHAYYINPFN